MSQELPIPSIGIAKMNDTQQKVLNSHITSRHISTVSYTFQHKVRFTMCDGDILLREISHCHHAFKKSE